jgi:Intracellular proteinase inhibitor
MSRMWTAAVLMSLFVFPLPHYAYAQENADVLKYSLKAVPGNIQVNRMPGTSPPRPYQEKLSFEVTDPTRTDYKGSAPSCKTYDVTIAPIDTPQQPVWIWSKGKMFCQHVTPVEITAAKSWKRTVVWKFTTADVKDGKYRATATFVPTNQQATIDFEITSVQ